MGTKHTFKSNRNVVYSNKYHVVWCVKYRRQVLSDDVSMRLKTIAAEVCTSLKVDLLEIEVMPDHYIYLLRLILNSVYIGWFAASRAAHQDS